MDCLDKIAADRIIIVDATITEIADPEFVALHQSESPRGVELAVCDQAPEEVAAGIEYVDEATAGTGNVILPSVILQRISHKDLIVESPDAERCVTSRKVGVNEAVGIHLLKILIKGVDLASMEICRKQEIVTVGDAEGCAFVNGAVNPEVCSVVDRNNGVRRVHGRVPT